RPELALDLLVELVERRAQPRSQLRTERRLAGTAQSDESDAPCPLPARLAEALLQQRHRLVALLGTPPAQQLDRGGGLRMARPVRQKLLERAAQRLGD